MRGTICSLGVLAALLTGCSSEDKAVSHSAPVGINLKAKFDAKSGSIYDEKAITTESGNPYGAFINGAKAKLGGVEPTRVAVSSVTLLLGADSKGVTALEQVFSGKVETLFEVGDTKNSYPVANVTDPTGGGPVDLSADFDTSDLPPTDRDKIIAGGFAAVIRGTAASGFAKSDGDADLQLTFTFSAYR
jgi:hypothetical protein